jgi:hypothetical protein
MSFKSSVIKMAIKWTPKKMILWVVNSRLKGIAELTDFSFDIDTRKAYVQVMLFGEAEPIEVSLENFAVINDEGVYKFILHQAHSNRHWLNNIFALVVGKAWKIPVVPQLASQMGLVSELFKARISEREAHPAREENPVKEES